MVRRAMLVAPTARAFCGVLCPQHRKIAVEQHSSRLAPQSAESTTVQGVPSAQGLYDPSNEHDACGVGFVAHIKGKKSHEIVQQGLRILHNLDHRGAVGADPLMGDGAGILLQIPDQFYREEMARQGVNLPPAGEYGVGMIFLP
jgi:glutamate synthase (NADPH/NADH) large chain